MDVHVGDPSVLDELREALIRFRTELTIAIAEADSDLRRINEWIAKERIPELRRGVPKLREHVVQAKSALARKVMNAEALKISASTVDEKEAVKRAVAVLEHHEDLAKKTVSWSRKLDHEYTLFKAQLSPLHALADRELPQAIARLRAMALAIESYLNLSPTASLDDQLKARARVQSVLRSGLFGGVTAEDGLSSSEADDEAQEDGA